MQYKFADFQIDLETLELRKGETVLAVEPKVFDLLSLLIRHNKQVLSKDKLLAEVWQGRIVSDAALSSAIKSARAVLGDTGTQQRFIKTVHGRGFRFVGDIDGATPANPATLSQDIRFCQAPDGTRIAYASTGQGAAVVKASNWMSHLEFELDSPIWRPWIEAFSARYRLVRYDERGNGLSGRSPQDVSFEARVGDLESVVDAAGPDAPFVLFGISAGAAISIEFAARHPDKVRALVLLGGFPQGWRPYGRGGEMAEALTAMIRRGWGRDTPAFRQLFTSLFFPEATEEHTDWFNELQRKTVSPEVASRLWEATGNLDVLHRLPDITVPALVIHALDDVLVPVENGELLASGLPDARFIALQSGNHLPVSPEPAFPRVFEEIDRFIGALP